MIVIPTTYAACKSSKLALNEAFNVKEEKSKTPPVGKRYCINCKYLSEPGQYVLKETKEPIQTCLLFNRDHRVLNHYFNCNHYEDKPNENKPDTNTTKPV